MIVTTRENVRLGGALEALICTHVFNYDSADQKSSEPVKYPVFYSADFSRPPECLKEFSNELYEFYMHLNVRMN